MDRIIGVCGECRGQVIMYDTWMGAGSPRALCQDCGARAYEQLPIIRMERPNKTTGLKVSTYAKGHTVAS